MLKTPQIVNRKVNYYGPNVTSTMVRLYSTDDWLSATNWNPGLRPKTGGARPVSTGAAVMLPKRWHRNRFCGIGRWPVIGNERALGCLYPMYSVLAPFPEDVALPRWSKVKMAPTNERRKWPRANVHWQVLFVDGDAEPLACTTRNISSGGFYVLSERLFIPGESVDCVLCIPAHDSRRGEDSVRVQCQVEVIRVDHTVDGRFGTAYRIIDYQVRGRRVTE
jgi:hypothetical protein